MDLSKDYYEILGVSPTIEPETLKAVFKALSKKYHPDTTAKASTSKRFRDIQEAFDVLKDPELRKNYDQRKLNEEGKQKNKAKAETKAETPMAIKPTLKQKGSFSKTKSLLLWIGKSVGIIILIVLAIVVFTVAVFLLAIPFSGDGT